MTYLSTWLRRAETLISFTALTVLVFCVLWGVLTRYVTERPAVWTTELSGIVFTWVVFIGALTAFRQGRHIRVTLLPDMLPARMQTALAYLRGAISTAFLGYVAYLSALMMVAGHSRPSPVLDIPFSWVYLATFICFAAMTVISALRLVGLAVEPAEDGGDVT